MPSSRPFPASSPTTRSAPARSRLGYRAEILNYVTLTAQDTVNHIAVGQVRLEFPKLLVNIRDDFVKTSDPPNTELTGPIESLTNVLAPEAEYRLTTRLAVGANYAWTHVRFPTNRRRRGRSGPGRAARRRVAVLEDPAQGGPAVQLQLRESIFNLQSDRDFAAHQVHRRGAGRPDAPSSPRPFASASRSAIPTRPFSPAISA